MAGQRTGPQSARIGRTLAESAPVFEEPRRPRDGAPNVVMIVLDDLGFAQLGCYGSAMQTPNMDALAGDGLRYNNFHVTAICGASRACLLTGRNHHAVGMGWLDLPMDLPGYSARIPDSAGMLPRHLRDSGYNTFAVGKWHLTPTHDTGPAGPFDRWPLGVGFERYYGFLGAETSQWTPELVCDNGFIDQPASPFEGYHVTEDLADQAIRMVQDQQQAGQDKPFFLYFATGATHSPHQVLREWVEPYRGRFDDGWEAMRQSAFERQRELGVVPADTTLTERPSWVPEWNGLSGDERRLFARMMEVYAGFLTHTDAQIGRVLDFLRRIDALDNTIVMVVSDNGASADGGPHGALDGASNFQVNDPASMLDRIDEIGGIELYNHYPWGWAWAGNTPFRLWKHYTWLGGVRTPLIVHWPAGIGDEQRGQVRGQFCHAIDLMPTVLEASGVEAPDVVDGVTQQPIDGQSILPTFTDTEASSPRDTQYFEMMGTRAIYQDGWKATTDHVTGMPAQRALVEGSRDYDADRWSLFHIAEDFSEAHDLADTEPDRLRRMVEMWWYEAGRNNVLPLMDGLWERFERMVPGPYADRRRWVFRPGGGPIKTPWSHPNFRMTADVEIPKDEDSSGIICAQGDWNSGWACYILDGRLVAAFNFFGSLERITASEPITAGRHEVGLTYEPGSDGPDGTDGSAVVTVDGHEIGSLVVKGTPDRARGMLLIGRDRGLPVCDDYRPPFAFTGQIHTITFELPPTDAADDRRDEIETALKHD